MLNEQDFKSLGYYQCADGTWRKTDRRGRVESIVSEPEDVPEKQIQKEIEDWLISLRPHCYFVRSRMDRATTFTQVGHADFLGWIKGRCFALECKCKGKKATLEQLAALKMAESAGAIVAVVHSLKEAQAVIGHLEHLP